MRGFFKVWGISLEINFATLWGKIILKICMELKIMEEKSIDQLTVKIIFTYMGEVLLLVTM